MSRKLDLPFFAGLLIAAVAFTLPHVREGDPDLGWHLANGRYIVEHHAIAHTDPFSYTAYGRPWIAHEWATDVLFYLLDRAWGIRGLVLFRQITQILGVVLTYLLCVRAGVHPLLALVGGAAYLFFVSVTLNARAQMLLPVYTLVLLHILLSYRRGRRRVLWWIVPLTVVWANTHGGFLLLFAILAAFAVDQAIEQPDGGIRAGRFAFRPRHALPIVGIGAIAAVTTLLNPNGLTGALYPLTYLSGNLAAASARIQEWQSPNFNQPIQMFPLLALMTIPVILAMAPTVPNLFQLVLLVCFTYAFLKAQRMVPMFGIAWIWVAAEALQHRFLKPYKPQSDPRAAPMAVSIFALAAVLFAAGLPWLKPVGALVNDDAWPVAVVQVAQDNGLSGRLFNTYRFGGYIVWRYYPKPVVFIDGRADVFAGKLFDDTFTMMHGKMGWRRLLRRYHIDWAIVMRSQALSELLRITPGWHLIYADNVACLFVHDGPANAKVLERWRTGKLRLPKATLLPLIRPNS